MPTRQEIIDYITQSATRRGIDPRVVLRVFNQESRLNPNAQNVTPREASYGIAQLNLKGGLGVEARRRGIEPTDPSQWKQHVDFSLDTVKRDGWRQWAGAKDTGVPRWGGVNSISDTGRTKNIDIGDEPTLQNLNAAVAKPTRNVRPEESAEASILKQSAPTEPEQVSEMARPSIKDAIRKSMDELGIKDNVQYAGFVPPGLTKGSAKTRAAANAQVQPRGGLPVERDMGPEVGTPYDRKAPGVRGMEGSYADYVRRQQQEMEMARQAREGGGSLPKGVKSATDPSGAADPRTGTAVAPYDPNLAAQNDPARQALIAAKIRGYAKPNGPTIDNGVSPRTAATVGAGGAIAAAAVDPAVEAVKEKIDSGANAAGAGPSRVANVDKGVEERGRQLGARPGQLSDPNTGYQTMAAGPLIGQAMPVFKEAMKDPQTATAVKQAATGLIRAKARVDAQAADQKNDPTFYQQQAARGQAPGGMQDDRAMERAVMMDNQRMMQRRGAQPSAPQPSVQPPQQQPTTRGTVRNIRSTPPEVRDADRPIPPEEIMPQAVPPGAEKGDVQPQRTPVPPGFPIPPHPVPTSSVMPTERGAATASAEGYPLTPGSFDPSGGVQGMPPSGQMQMDPVMMQLMQFFTQGGGGGDFSSGP